MNREILNLKNLSVSYGDINILKDIDLSLKKGEILGIVGESGSGKSTLLNCISTIDKVTSGHIYLNKINNGYFR